HQPCDRPVPPRGDWQVLPWMRTTAHGGRDFSALVRGFVIHVRPPFIASAMVLGFGRALGETMALAMLIGNSNQINLSLFAPAQTLASLLASHFPEAGQVEVQALMYAALVLLAITLVVNMMGTAILTLAQRRISGRS